MLVSPPGPMSKRLLVSTGASARLREAAAWLLEAAGGGGEVLVLAPTRGAADDLLRRGAPESGSPAAGGLFGVHRATPLQLASELATRPLAERRLAPVSALGVEALAARSIARCHDAGSLAYFEPVAASPGLARALAATLREIRSQQVDRGRLAATGAPGADLARLLDVYEDELARFALADDALVFELAGEQCASARHYLLGLPVLALDLSPAATAERRFLAALVGRAPSALAVVPEGDAEGREALEEIFATPAAVVEEPPPTSRLERLRRHVFLPDLAATAPELDDDESVAFLTAPGEGRECVEIARRIRDLALAGVPFDSVAILLRDPRSYLPLVEEALERARIPAYFTRGTVRPHPAGRAFLALLACAAENYSASRFAEYLSLGQVPRLDEAGAPAEMAMVPWVEPEGDQLVFKSFLPAAAEDDDADAAPTIAPNGEVVEIAGSFQAPRHWERLLVDAAVLGGKERWEKRLDGLAAEIELKLRELADDEIAQRRRLEKTRRQLENLKRFALPVIEALAALPEEAPWGRWLAALRQLASRVLRRPGKVLTVLADLQPLEQVGPVSLDEVRQVLEERLTFLRTEPPPRRYGAVLVATVAEARGRSFDVVFLPGLAEGIFPRRASEDPLLLDVHREQLGGLPTQRQRVARERLLLRVAAGAARRKLVVSYPNLDPMQGRARVPSFYALDVLRAAEGLLPDLSRLEARAASESASLLGWPAPRTPERAIDDAEFDLSTLAGLLRRDAVDSVSRGRYMLEANPALMRSLRSRYLRWRRKFSWADGVVGGDGGTREVLAKARLDQRGYSPTALQAYAACPYRFLLYAVLRLRPRDEVTPLEQLDPLTRGSLFHEVQYELHGTLRERGLLPMRTGDLAALFDLADAALDGVAERYRQQLEPAIPRVYTSEIEGLRTDLRGWIRTVTGLGESWRPAYFELSFGLPLDPDHDPASRRAPARVLDGKLLRGSIDMVEVDEARGTLRVTDHKTGRPLRKKKVRVGGGETLQPLLYALAAEQVLGQPVESGRLFYCTRRGEYEIVEVPADDASRQDVATVLATVDRAVAEGFLPAAPKEGACRFCDYQMICGPFEEMRLKRKSPEALVRLSRLRRMP